MNNDKILSFDRDYAVPVTTLFQAWADRSKMMEWWKDLKVPGMDFREGGNYRLEFDNSTNTVVEGSYREIIPNQKIVFTWSTEKMITEGSGTKDSIVTLTFKSTGPESCEMNLSHADLLTEAAREEHSKGWPNALRGLQTAMETGRAPRRNFHKT